MLILTCRGLDGNNEVLYLAPQDEIEVQGNVVFLPGDVQDLRDRM